MVRDGRATAQHGAGHGRVLNPTGVGGADAPRPNRVLGVVVLNPTGGWRRGRAQTQQGVGGGHVQT
jgi:hypothetical protein